MTGMCTAIANYLIKKTNDYNEGRAYGERILMSCKRLQKLLYFSEVLYMLRNNGTPMFQDDFYAWTSGPVIPEVYEKFEKYQNGVMLPVDMENYIEPTRDVTEVLDVLFENTIGINTTTLINESHVKGGPWDRIYNVDDNLHRQKLDKNFTYRFYSEHPEALLFLNVCA